MIGITNSDSSFFDVKIGSSPLSAVPIINDRIISFEITEELHRIISGNISLEDPYYTSIDKLLRLGQKIEISWGYKRPDISLLNILQVKDNPQEIQGLFQRTGIHAYIMNVSGGGSEDGKITYDCGFIGSEFLSGVKWKMYSKIPRRQIVGEAMARMGITIQLINFNRMNQVPDQNTAVIQDRSNFKFLNEMAFREDAVFAVGQGSKGSVGLFAGYNTSEAEQFNNMVTNSSGNTVSLSYKEGAPNVSSYTFQQQVGDMAGDNAQVMWIGGQVVVKRFKAETQTIYDYKLNPDKIRKDVNSKNTSSAKIKFAADLLMQDNIEELCKKGYFQKTAQVTAPQGYGWTFNVNMIGNPLLTSPTRVRFIRGFPSVVSEPPSTSGGAGAFSKAKTRFWTRAVTHRIDTNGYRCTLDVCDALTLTGGSFVG